MRYLKSKGYAVLQNQINQITNIFGHYMQEIILDLLSNLMRKN